MLRVILSSALDSPPGEAQQGESTQRALERGRPARLEVEDEHERGATGWAFGGGSRMQRKTSVSAAAGSHPCFGLLGWDERVRQFGKKGRLPKTAAFDASEHKAAPDFPAITVTSPSFCGRPISRAPTLGDSDSDESLDELLLSIHAGLARNRKRQSRQMRRRPATSASSSSSESSSDSSDSSSEASSSGSDTQSSSPRSPWTPVRESRKSSQSEGAGISLEATPTPPLSP